MTPFFNWVQTSVRLCGSGSENVLGTIGLILKLVLFSEVSYQTESENIEVSYKTEIKKLDVSYQTELRKKFSYHFSKKSEDLFCFCLFLGVFSYNFPENTLFINNNGFLSFSWEKKEKFPIRRNVSYQPILPRSFLLDGIPCNGFKLLQLISINHRIFKVDFRRSIITYVIYFRKYRGWLDCLRQTAAEDGAKVLTRGLGPCLLRAFPVCAILFTVQNKTDNMLKSF